MVKTGGDPRLRIFETIVRERGIDLTDKKDTKIEDIIFWSAPEKAGELAEKIGMKGDGKTRLLGFGLPTATYELEEQLPGLIRSAFAAAREHDMAVMLHFDFHLAWKKRPDLWNWFDPNKPGYNPDNKYNVEWHGWDGPPNEVGYLNHGVLERRPPNMCFTSSSTRPEVTRIVSKIIGPVLLSSHANFAILGNGSISGFRPRSQQRLLRIAEDGQI